jgi:hypothetical protein
MEQKEIDYNLEENKIEDTDESHVHIKVPFDPNLIRIRRDPFTLGELIDKIEHEEINFFTLFQRKDNLWDETKQSRLIESILLKLPLPAFYFDEIEKEDDKTKEKAYLWQVIDGLQRCSVLRNFAVNKTMSLVNLEFLTQFDSNTYADLPKEQQKKITYDKLPRELQRRITQTPITVYVVEKGTPEEVKFNIFKRINTGGLILTPQEIRHALNQGVAADFVAQLAEEESFKEATCWIIKTDRMEDRDFVTRFVSFYITPYTEYQPDLDSFMTRGMGLIKTLSPDKRKKMKEDFIKTMNMAVVIFGEDAFRKRIAREDRRKPINKALFETLSVAFSKLTDNERKILADNSEVFIDKFIALHNDQTFYNSLASGTGLKPSVTKRFSEINRIVNETISNKDDKQTDN